MSVNEVSHGEQYREEGITKDDQVVRFRDHVSGGFHKMGEVLPYADQTSDITPGRMSQVGQSTYVAASDHTHNTLLQVVVANPTDGVFEDPKDGVMCASDVGGTRRLWVRIGGAWRSVVVA